MIYTNYNLCLTNYLQFLIVWIFLLNKNHIEKKRIERD